MEPLRSSITSWIQLDAMKASELRKTEAMLEGEAVLTAPRLPVFSHDFGPAFKDSLVACRKVFWVQDDLTLLSVLKQLKYFWNLSQSHVAILLERLVQEP